MDFIFGKKVETERITYTESKIDLPIVPPPPTQQSAPVVNFVMPPIPVSTPAPAPVPVSAVVPMVMKSMLSPAPLPVQVGNSNFSPNTETYPSIGTSYFLTDAQTSEDWSRYPAVTNVDIGGFDIVNLSTITTTNLVSDNIDTKQIDTASGLNGGIVNTSKVQLQRIGTNPGQIQMFDNNNVPHILESVDSDLYFDNQLLAKVSDIADWALYPALADVDLVGQKLKGASEVQLGSLVLTDNAGILDVNGQPVSANWALYPATQDVDLASKDITNVAKINGSAYVATKDWSTQVAVGNVDLANNNILNVTDINGSPYPPTIANWSTIPASQDVDLANFNIDNVTDINGAPYPPTIANWSTIPASQDVDLANFNIDNVTDINGSPYVATRDWSTQVAVGNVDLANNNILNVTDINGAPYPPVVPNWSTIPATQNVDLANFNILNVTDINGSPYPPTIPNWSTIPATQNVDLANFNILNVTDINGSPYPPTASNWSTFPATQNVDLANFDITNVTNINGAPYPPVGVVTSVNGGVGAITITGDVNTIVTNVVGTTTTISAPTLGVSTDLTTTCWGTANSASLSATSAGIAAGTAQTTALGAQATATSAAVAASAAEATALLALSQSGVTQVNGGTRQVTIAAGTGVGVVTTFSSGTLDPTITISASSFLSLYSIYVAPNGNDTTGTGSANNPYLTIGRALTARGLISNTIEVAIQLFPGTYSPVSLGISVPQNTFLVGIPAGEITQPVNIVAQVALNAGTGTVGLYGLNLFPASSQCVVINGVGTYNINNCNIFNNGGNYAIVQSLGTLYLTECRVTSPTSGTFPGIGVTGNTASLIMRDCLLTSSGTPSMVSCIGNLTMRQCVLINTSTSASVNPLVNFNPTAAGNSCEISYSTLQYTSAVSALNKICVRANPTIGITAAFVNFVFNFLICEGAQSGGGTYCIDRVSAGGSVTISYGNLLAGATAKVIDPTITKSEYSALPGQTFIPPPAPVIQVAGTTALIPSSANTTYILTSGATQNFTTAGLGAGNAGSIWFVKNAASSGGDISIQSNGSPIVGQTATLHAAGGSNNTGSQILYWSGTTLTMY